MVICAMSRDHQTDVRKDAVSRAEDNYLRTLDEITERLKNTDGSMNKPQESIELDDKNGNDNKDGEEHVKCPVA